MSNHDPAAFAMAAREAGFFGFGFCPRVDFIHIDLGPKRKWGERFAPRPAYRDALRWVFVAVALAGIVLAIYARHRPLVSQRVGCDESSVEEGT